MKSKIIYSKHHFEKIMDMLDRVLAFRDKYLFATVLKGCERGYLPGAEPENYFWGEMDPVRMTKAQRRKYRIYTFAWLLPFLLLDVFLCLGFGIVMARSGKADPLLLLFGAGVILFWAAAYMQTLAAAPLRIGTWRMHSFTKREDLKDHVWHSPVFYGFCRIKAKKQLAAGKKALETIDVLSKEIGTLHILSYYSEFSDWLRQNSGVYRGEDLQLEITGGRTEGSTATNYKIIIKEAVETGQDTVVPVDTEPKSFELPYDVGAEVIRKYERTGVMDLSIRDKDYYALKNTFQQAKKRIRQTMLECGVDVNAPVFCELEQLKF